MFINFFVLFSSIPYYCIVKFIKTNKNWVVFGLLILGIIPIIITLNNVISSNEKSIVFLENYGQGIVFLVIIYYVILLGLGIYWFIRKLIYITNLRSEKSKVELMLLRSQVSPHFFFNMLNNLYGLVKIEVIESTGWCRLGKSRIDHKSIFLIFL